MECNGLPNLLRNSQHLCKSCDPRNALIDRCDNRNDKTCFCRGFRIYACVK